MVVMEVGWSWIGEWKEGNQCCRRGVGVSEMDRDWAVVEDDVNIAMTACEFSVTKRGEGVGVYM